ncbi:MAG: uroporphyrinogen-III synthase [Thiomicrorhabdus sp.]|nr:MAG: uroporphyrinogen-III synthase [Thiomicrorhabdus sp.]
MSTSFLFTLLNTRPAHQAEALSQAVLAMNGVALNCPTIEIEWLDDEHNAQALSQMPEQIDKIMFTSVNAVEGFIKGSFVTSLQPLIANSSQVNYYAIGRATQLKGLAANLPLVTLSETQFDSESLLEHPTMKSVAGESILIIKGQGGRPVLIETFQARGANVAFIDVYKRVASPLCSENWQIFTQSIQPILLITSVESFESLLTALIKFDVSYGNMDDTIWSFLHNTIVFSQRIKQHLQDQGWQSKISIVAQQSNEGTLQCIKQSLSTAS